MFKIQYIRLIRKLSLLRIINTRPDIVLNSNTLAVRVYLLYTISGKLFIKRNRRTERMISSVGLKEKYTKNKSLLRI